MSTIRQIDYPAWRLQSLQKKFKLPFVVSVLESIVKDLESLSTPKLVEVAHYISRLNPRRREERLAALKATAGSLSGEEGAAFEDAVREEGDRIDHDDWK